MLTKTEIITKYRNELREIRLTKDLRIQERLELSLAREYLITYPELNDYDCSGIGLPAYHFKRLTTGII